jgi:hypothetical protein
MLRRPNATEDEMMTTTIAKTAIVSGAIAVSALAGLLMSTSADARGRGKEFYSQDYQVDGPVKGFEGRSGDYYCSYQRLPNRVCAYDANGNEHCKIKGWTLRQHCY